MRRLGWLGCVALIMLAIARPAFAWGPVARASLTSMGVHILSQDGSIPLKKLQTYVHQGARLTERERRELFPTFEFDSVHVIENEMYLLQSLRGERVDPYFAYRLGVLGSLVAQATGPMVAANPRHAARYDADVDREIGGVRVNPSNRMLVDPAAYFLFARKQAQDSGVTIEKDYQSGAGFNGFARAVLFQDVGRSVAAIADVWYTIFATDVAFVNVSRGAMRKYTLGAIQFYLDHSKIVEAADAYARVQSLHMLTPDLQKDVGDLYFEVGQFERAMEEYRKVLEVQPQRHDVMKKVASFYEQGGDKALEEGRLEDARDAFAQALLSDPLHPRAQRRLQESESRIIARDERHLAARMGNANGQELEAQAEEAVLRKNYAQAIVYLKEGEKEYAAVGAEFPKQAQSARIGLRSTRIRIRELKEELILNAQEFSGSGFSHDARKLAADSRNLSKDVLNEMVRAEFQNAVQGLSNEMSSIIAIR